MKKIKQLVMLTMALYAGMQAHAQNTLTIADTRSVRTIPSNYTQSLALNFKLVDTIQLANSGGVYTSIIGLRGGVTDVGGKAHEMAFSDNNNIYVRSGFLAGWEGWRRLLNEDVNGNVAIGNSTAIQKLDVVDTLTDVYVPVNGPSAYPPSVLSIANRAAVDGSASSMMFSARNASGANTMAYIAAISNPTGASADLVLGRRNNTTYSESMRIVAATGNVGIGTSAPGTYKLAVEGTIGARKVKVTATSWADFVFDPNYKRRTLEETEAFIKINQHLPDVPSASEVQKDGQDLGEMNKILLQKVEELTLELIEMKKEIKELKDKK